jgi:[histone H3]-trimethyl-L-lysine4 demethylase
VQNNEGLTFEEFNTMAKNFEEKYFKAYEHLSHKERTLELEKEYWKIVEDNLGKKVVVQYAADLSSEIYGSGFPKHCDNDYSSNPWNLNNINQLKDSLLQI